MIGENDVDALVDREIIGAALGSGAEDAFWVLVCEDEEWLQSEFESIVSEPTEVLDRVGHLLVGAETNRRATHPAAASGCSWRGVDGPQPHLSRERTPGTPSPTTARIFL